MNNHQVIRKCVCAGLIGAVLWVIPGAQAQVSPDVAEHGYAETIFVNGKIVSMDDYSASASTGSVYQAVAIKRDVIIKLGTNAAVRALEGPDTQVLEDRGAPEGDYQPTTGRVCPCWSGVESSPRSWPLEARRDGPRPAGPPTGPDPRF